MKFFEEQRKARQRTSWLVIYFLLFVLLISALLGLGITLAFLSETRGSLNAFLNPVSFKQWLDFLLHRTVFISAFLINALAIVGVSLFKMYRLKSGDTVAIMMGGVALSSSTLDAKERRLMNIVEEMSLASGVQAPMVYVLNDQLSVNAFAAGWEPSKSVIAVTKGCLDILDRDELQGVIAHEFSHILNGDMVLNMRLIGIISGLVFLTEIGNGLLRGSRRTSSSKRKGISSFYFVGFVLSVVGGLGVFGARVLQAAVSRQRELLADASAAQFTRNPGGLARALAKIFHGVGSKIKHAATNEVSHLFFSEATRFSFFGFETHPPLEERIKLLDPKFSLLEFGKTMAVSSGDILKSYTHVDMEPIPQLVAEPSFSPQQIINSVGQPSFLNVEVTKNTLKNISVGLLTWARDQEKALSVLLGIVLISQNEKVQEQVLQTIGQQSEEDLLIIQQLRRETGNSLANVFVLLQISLGSIKQLPIERRDHLITSLNEIFKLDGFVNFSEVLLGLYIQEVLLPASKPSQKGSLKFHQVQSELDILIFWLIGNGRDQFSPEEGAEIKSHYLKAVALFQNSPARFDLLPPVSLASAEKLCARLKGLDLKSKSRVIEILWNTLQNEKLMTFQTVENTRLLCSLLGAPVPPFIQFAS